MAAILYGQEMHEVSSLEYCEWEDLLDGIVGNTDDERLRSTEWITYNFLMDKGYLVAEPRNEDPAKIPKSKRAKKQATIPDAPLLREPKWTPSQMLREREKILREKEKIFEYKKKLFVEQSLRMQANKFNKNQMFHEDGSPYKSGNYINVILVLVLIIICMAICMAAK